VGIGGRVGATVGGWVGATVGAGGWVGAAVGEGGDVGRDSVAVGLGGAAAQAPSNTIFSDSTAKRRVRFKFSSLYANT